MKVAKKLKKVLCAGLAGCLILGCLTGCGGEVCFGPEDKECTKYVIPDGTMAIADSAFCNCTELTSIKIPSGVTSIGGYAFSVCTALKTVKVPEGLNVRDCGLGSDVQVIYY